MLNKAGLRQRPPDRSTVGLKPSATDREGRLRGLIQPAQAGFAIRSRAIDGDGHPGELTLPQPC
ncbi:hypothetical protein [Candidatus Chloroploca sp. Khr17]|uniref:hypothetical protein n=1 Tax=Candidatus Chloroploca sp. Khr17 TaxID=2496869 RepID=UPI00101DB40C|nr:hypothetical protein [Candidatus Chloroploca sp. Khr17]